MKREKNFLYSKLANILREQIYSGYIRPGQFLMSEFELCQYYGLSRTSVRRSLDKLLQEGLIIKKTGQGTMVSPDLVIPKSERKVLRIAVTSPSYFVDHVMPLITTAFQQKYPHVELKLIQFPTVNFWESVRTMRENGIVPDLIFITDRQFNELDPNDKHYVELGEPFKNQLRQIYPRLLDACLRQDKLIAVPVTFSTVYLAYNPQLFEKYGVSEPRVEWTKEDFLRAAQKLTVDTDGDGIVDQYGLLLSPSVYRWPVFALQQGITRKEHLEKLAVVRTFTFLHDLLYRYRVATLSRSSNNEINSRAFMRGKAAMVMTTSVELGNWQGEGMGFEARVATMPFGHNSSTLLLANTFMIPTASSEQELALFFLETALDPSLQETLSRKTGFLSVHQAVNEKIWDKPYLNSLQLLDTQLRDCYFLYEWINKPSVLKDWEQEMDFFWSGLESAESFSSRFIELVQTSAPGDSQD
ncbi:extracellular solute-binding protein [Paenibacillus senegalensis]|uniref:extracellular solute-binding protein n=1 Tax=Paenibacillus senegalensis TaxID=1465766 RepID=UPI00028886FC|nr:extracellular solute-binding protein [Paenibacillus senegalensis]